MKQRLLIPIGAILVGGLLLLSLSCSSNNSSQQGSSTGTNAEESNTASTRKLSPEEAAALLQQQERESGCTEEDTYARYEQINHRFADPDGAWNLREEPLVDFAKRFSADANFRKTRYRLSQESDHLPAIGSGRSLLKVFPPDESGFFASWEHIDKDSAAFCSGWIDSEKWEEYAFSRIDSKWYLVDYFKGTTVQE